MSRPYAIREVRPDRAWLERIGRLRVAVWRDEGAIAEERFAGGVWIDRFDASARHWVAEDEAGALVATGRLTLHAGLADSPDGYVWLDAGRDLPAPIANIAKLVVSARARRRGLASALNRARLDAARATAARTVTVTASAANARLLSQQGFQHSGLDIQFPDRPGVTFFALELELRSASSPTVP